MTASLHVMPPTAQPRLRVYGRAALPTRFGAFTAYSFRHLGDAPIDDIALACGDLAGDDPVPTRVHSECLTGDALASTRCDCRDQLELALRWMDESPRALLVYLRQEGRGIGIGHKIRAYELQDSGLDTVEANLHMGYDDDLRSYEVAAAMLRALEIRRIELWTNNVGKIRGLTEHGIEVSRRLSIVTPPRPENARYLQTKRDKSGHLL